MRTFELDYAICHGFSKRERMTGANRLRRMAEYLRTVPTKEFNLNVVREKTPCGTAACVMGHAPFVPGFRRLGLKLTEGRVEDDSEPDTKLFDIEFDGDNCWWAAAKFFRLSDDEAERLFGTEDTYRGNVKCPAKITPKFVAKHLDAFADKMEAAYV